MSEAKNNRQEILLEAGTNEFEIVEFTIGKVNYGINIAKVRGMINLAPFKKGINLILMLMVYRHCLEGQCH